VNSFAGLPLKHNKMNEQGPRFRLKTSTAHTILFITIILILANGLIFLYEPRWTAIVITILLRVRRRAFALLGWHYWQ
jgi:hypothetical protein